MRSPLISTGKLTLLLYVAVMAAAAMLFSPQRLSTDLLGVFPQNTQTAQLRDASSLQMLNRLVVVSKGFDTASRERIKAIAQSVRDVEGVVTLNYRSDTFDPALAASLQSGFYQRARLKEQALDDVSIRKKLEALYAEASSSFIMVPIDTADPLGLFEDPMKQLSASSRGGYLTLGEEGYLLSATLDVPVADVEGARKLMEALQTLLKPYGADVVAFAPHYFTAQNSANIKGEVNLIVTATLLLLLLFYALALRNFKVLVVTSLALGGSLFVGLSAVTAWFESVSVFTLAFGSGIVMMAVDYFFHYYFHGYYSEASSGRRKVLFAFLTTFTGFGILFFADFPLIEQLSLFAVAALAFAYFQFTFLLAPMRFEPKAERLRMPAPAAGLLRPRSVALLSFGVLAVAASQLEFDGDLKRLDYQNSELQELQRYVAGAVQKQVPVLIYGESLDEVVARSEALRERYALLRSPADLYRSEAAYNSYLAKLEAAGLNGLGVRVEAIATEVGFRKGTFADAYALDAALRERQSPDQALLSSLGYETKKLDDGRWMSLGFVPFEAAEGFDATEGSVLLHTSKILENSVERVSGQLLLIGAMTLGAIALFFIVMLRSDALRAMNYILFPLSMILLLLAFTSPLSLMHAFALIIVMVAGIDYGIYMSSPEAQTDEAIYYAMLTTFSGFGIFVFSNIGALHHIGIVIATGIAATFLLQRIQLRRG